MYSGLKKWVIHFISASLKMLYGERKDVLMISVGRLGFRDMDAIIGTAMG